MVATILKSVTAKGIEAASQSVSSGLHSNPGTPSIVPQQQPHPSIQDIPEMSLLSNNSSSKATIEVTPQQHLSSEGLNSNIVLQGDDDMEDSYVSSITNFLSDTKTSLASISSSASEDASRLMGSYISGSFSNLFPSSSSSTAHSPIEHESLKIIAEEEMLGRKSTPRKSLRKQSSVDLNWLSHNPYTTVTGRGGIGSKHFRPNQSVDAVRNLLELVTIEEEEAIDTSPFSQVLSSDKAGRIIDASDRVASFESILEEDGSYESSSVDHTNLASSMSSLPTGDEPKKRKISKAETASRLGEGTIRALRDLALDEALELRHALRYWTERLERPMLYYIESGPKAWMSQEDHRLIVGEKVATVQAVLARRVNSIGDLQQHLWRAGWQRGIAQWGILGQGSEWAAVAGGYGGISDDSTKHDNMNVSQKSKLSFFASAIRGVDKKKESIGKNGKTDYYGNSLLLVRNSRGGQILTDDPALAEWAVDAIRVVRDQLYSAGSGTTPLPHYKNWPSERTHFSDEESSQSKKIDWREMTRGGSVGNSMLSMDVTDLFEEKSNAFLPTWAIEDFESLIGGEAGISLETRDQLDSTTSKSALSQTDALDFVSSQNEKLIRTGDIKISNLALMASEVNEILNTMQLCMEVQRQRRLDKLKPPPRLVRNWYILALGIPTASYIAFKLMNDNAASNLPKEIFQKMAEFCNEHISEPLISIYQELFTKKGRDDVTDRKARRDVIDVLKKMIKSWLDENHPGMSETDRSNMALAMDMNLIEQTKEQAIKNILEINGIVRMSLIEMQFIKKEMMNALYAMDDLMGSNEINIKLAAMGPAVLIASFIRFGFRTVYYAVLKIGKSKEQTYSSFRHVILDIERLLVMRDNPPSPPEPLRNGVKSHFLGNRTHIQDSTITNLSAADTSILQNNRCQQNTSMIQEVLSPDDLGMLMLLVHECRSILWHDRKRFSKQELLNLSEDLAELAGERGAVSVRQQLRIIARMCRTYSFLKVISSGIPFSVEINT